MQKTILQRKSFLLRARRHALSLGASTRIMGIINMTPDSFSQDGCISIGGKGKGPDTAIRKALTFIRQGADIIDIGGESSRPGAKRIPLKEELARVIPVIKALAQKVDNPISVDTYKPLVARHALDAGASIVNTIMGTSPDRRLLKMVQHYEAAVILMHMRGTPRTMQNNIVYNNLITEIKDSLQKSLEICLEIGIKSDRIILDPGIGFGKTAEHNLEIINRLNEFQSLRCPLLIGTSRKSFIGKVLREDVPRQRTWGTAATVCASILKGAHILRVHDVKEMIAVARMTDAIINQSFI
ncbi:MAG TPA: dihydropteroate synthase [Candidatus Omnitrophota bacterium]|nr:dihydropteroate synthase [Candidatus Omnitrophota bacterium]